MKIRQQSLTFLKNSEPIFHFKRFFNKDGRGLEEGKTRLLPTPSPSSRNVEYEGEGDDGEGVEEVLHGVVALREAHRRVALHRHRDRRPHGARQRDLDHRQPVRRQPGPAKKDIDVYSYSLCISSTSAGHRAGHKNSTLSCLCTTSTPSQDITSHVGPNTFRVPLGPGSQPANIRLSLRSSSDLRTH